jgi:hypothetical protein
MRRCGSKGAYAPWLEAIITELGARRPATSQGGPPGGSNGALAGEVAGTRTRRILAVTSKVTCSNILRHSETRQAAQIQSSSLAQQAKETKGKQSTGHLVQAVNEQKYQSPVQKALELLTMTTGGHDFPLKH